MIRANIPYNESQRLQALHDLQIIDTAYEDLFTDVVELASRICETPISLITLVDADRQWFKARKGLEITQTSRSASFCAHAILQNEVFIVADAATDSRFRDNEWVTGEPNIRFYAGAQITSPQGHKLGTLCVIDSQPKELRWQQVSALRTLSQQVSGLIELRHLQSLQQQHRQTVQDNEAFIQNMSREKQRMSRLVQQQTENLALQLQSSLSPLKTGAFTKKSLSAITAGINSQLEQSALFAQAVAWLSHCEEAATEAEAFLVHECVDAVITELETAAQERRSKINSRLSATLSFFHNRALIQYLLKSFLYRTVCAGTKTDISILVLQKQNGLELRISATGIEINTALAAFSIEMKNEAGDDLRPKSYELALLYDLLKKMNGDFEIMQLGQDGTEILLSIPEIKKSGR